MARLLDISSRAVQLDPGSIRTQVTAGKAAMISGHLDLADEYLAAGAQIEPDNPILHQVRGIVAHKRGDDSEARSSFITAAKANPRKAGWTQWAVDRMDESDRSWIQRLRNKRRGS